MFLHHIRRGHGKPLLLIHGLGGSWRSWQPVLEPLSQARQLIVIDLPGHGETPRLQSPTTIPSLADAVTAFLRESHLAGIDAVGSSMGARLVLELARRGVLGHVVALNPGGFWRGWERHAFFASLWASIRLVRLLQPAMSGISKSAVGRTLLLSQLSARPWRLPPDVVLTEMRSYAKSPVFDELLYELSYGAEQQGAPAGSITSPLTIGWGRRDRVCFPRQARRALALFPDARIHWFERSGHFPHWDTPAEAIRAILVGTGGRAPDVLEGFDGSQHRVGAATLISKPTPA